mmetsp:Transcript_40830/g.82273  ORF Transcript_40830/g.82273 Transcript_40830/m.82273 type:complete len:247 (+) Transcript_40830:164-904(+)
MRTNAAAVLSRLLQALSGRPRAAEAPLRALPRRHPRELRPHGRPPAPAVGAGAHAPVHRGVHAARGGRGPRGRPSGPPPHRQRLRALGRLSPGEASLEGHRGARGAAGGVLALRRRAARRHQARPLSVVARLQSVERRQPCGVGGRAHDAAAEVRGGGRLAFSSHRHESDVVHHSDCHHLAGLGTPAAAAAGARPRLHPRRWLLGLWRGLARGLYRRRWDRRSRRAGSARFPRLGSRYAGECWLPF